MAGIARIRPAIAKIEPYRPGSSVAEVKARVLGLERVVKLGSNESCLPPLAASVEAAARAAEEANRYPDPWCTALRELLAELHRVEPDMIVPGNGADELIRLIAQVLLEPGRSCVYPWPGFPTHAQAATAAGARLVPVATPPRRLDLEALGRAVDETTALVFIANPNNPTGASCTAVELRRFVRDLPPHVVCVLDEAYFEFVDPAARADGIGFVKAGESNVCALRTFSKAHGLAAFRVGYAVAGLELADALNRVRTMFNVNAPGQAAALAALARQDEIELRAAATRRDRDRLARILRAARLEPSPSEANFVFAEVPGPDGRPSAAAASALADELLVRGVIVRRMEGFGAPTGLRVTVGCERELDFLEAALHALDAGGRGEPS